MWKYSFSLLGAEVTLSLFHRTLSAFYSNFVNVEHVGDQIAPNLTLRFLGSSAANLASEVVDRDSLFCSSINVSSTLLIRPCWAAVTRLASSLSC